MSLQECYNIVYKSSVETFTDGLSITRGKPIHHIKDWAHYGFQGTALYRAYQIISKCIKDESYRVILGFTSNAGSGGVRDILTQLCKRNLVDGLVFTSGALEEDVIKCNNDFVIFEHRDLANRDQEDMLRTYGLNRTQNLLVPNNGYIRLEKNLTEIFQEYYADATFIEPIDLVSKLAKYADASSFLYWAHRLNIQYYPLCLEDCAIGDFLIFEADRRLKKSKEIRLDALSTLRAYYDNQVLSGKRICVIILGSGTVKHYMINPFIAKGGVDTAIFINNGAVYDGSNGSASIEEAISWGKIKPTAQALKVHGDFNIVFPLIATQLITDYDATNRAS